MDIYNKNNKQGYKLNVNHPLIRGYYNRFKKLKNISPSTPCSDAERFEFEAFMFEKVFRRISPVN